MKKKTKFFLLSLILLSMLICAYVLHRSIKQCQTEISTVNHTVETNLETPIRIVQLTDLHSCQFGENNADLVALILKQQPDLIVMTGDMMDKSDSSPQVICTLIQTLSRETPVWYAFGNHETEWMNATGTDLTPLLEEAGAQVLDCSYQDITVAEQPLRIGGYHAYYRYPGMYKITPEQMEAELLFADNFEDTQHFKLLLCHIPTVWLDWNNIDNFPVDLVLSGHNHGGQIRLPLLGGVYAPYVGLFPEYTSGRYVGQKAVCVLSAGLGSSPGIPRINNLPELTVIDLIPKSRPPAKPVACTGPIRA